jgi:hypothetical protein
VGANKLAIPGIFALQSFAPTGRYYEHIAETAKAKLGKDCKPWVKMTAVSSRGDGNVGTSITNKAE